MSVPSTIEISKEIWAIYAVVISVALSAIGVVVKGRVFGILVDSRNKMSLSRFQVVLWTILFTSAILAVGLARDRSRLL